MVAWKMPTFFNVWRLTVVHSYSKKMLESVTTKSKKKLEINDTETPHGPDATLGIRPPIGVGVANEIKRECRGYCAGNQR